MRLPAGTRQQSLTQETGNPPWAPCRGFVPMRVFHTEGPGGIIPVDGIFLSGEHGLLADHPDIR